MLGRNSGWRTIRLSPHDDRPDQTPTPDVQALTALMSEQARHALAALPYVKREALVLSYWGGYTQREIATLTRAPIGTVKTRMHHALKELTASLVTRP